jgi:DNA adenine methylase
MQTALFQDNIGAYKTPNGQLLKWIGNKQRFATEIAEQFPRRFNRYFEPFLGSGAVMATVAPLRGVGSDTFKPLVDIWKALRNDPELLVLWYAEREGRLLLNDKVAVYESVKASYNANPNGEDFIFLSRACYGGVIRFRKADGYMSTPCGVHTPISTESFRKRVVEWHKRVSHCDFVHCDYQQAFDDAKAGDLIYCDPPYTFSQAILYGAQSFSLKTLLESIDKAKSRGVYVALSIDGNKKSGDFICDLPIPHALFEKESLVNCGRSMLKRFQMEGQTLEKEIVADRLLLTY